MTTEKVPYTGPVPDHLRTYIERADEVIGKGGAVFWKFTCARCSSRQTFEDANELYMTGTCQACGHVTDLLTAAADVGFDALIPCAPGATPVMPWWETPAPPWPTRCGTPSWCAAIAADEAREAAVFDTLRAIAPHLNARVRRILYAFHGSAL